MAQTGVVYYTLIGLYCAYALIFGTLFFVFHKYEPIKSRGWTLSLITAFVTMVFFCFFAAIQVELDQGNGIPCDVTVWFSVLFLPFWVTPYLLRGELVVFQYWHNVGKLSQQAQSFYLTHRRRLSSRRIQVATYLGIVFLFSLLSLIVEFAANRPKKGNLSVSMCLGPQGYVVGAQGVVYILSIIFFIYHLWKAKEVFSIRSELLTLIVICVPVYITIGIVLVYPGGFPANFKSNWLLMIIVFCSFTISILYPLLVALQAWKWREEKTIPFFKREISNSNMISPELLKTDEFFALALINEELLRSFKSFTVESWCVESILFYMETMRFEDADPGEEEQRQIAEKILREHIILGSSLEINIDSSTRERIMEQISSGDLHRGVFDEAKKVVYSQLRYDVFPKWVRTGGFKHAFDKSGLKRSPTIRDVQSEAKEKRRQKADSIAKEAGILLNPSQTMPLQNLPENGV